jgi:hypothetical protein
VTPIGFLRRRKLWIPNQHMRTSSQNGTFGTHPCDPYVSPHLDRLFDTNFAEVRIGPARLPTK